MDHRCSLAMHSELLHPEWDLTLHGLQQITLHARYLASMLDTVWLHTASGPASVDFFTVMLLSKCHMITTMQANSIVALDLDTGDISWSIQLGPLESWVYSCISSAALNLNLSGVDIHL